MCSIVSSCLSMSEAMECSSSSPLLLCKLRPAFCTSCRSALRRHCLGLPLCDLRSTSAPIEGSGLPVQVMHLAYGKKINFITWAQDEWHILSHHLWAHLPGFFLDFHRSPCPLITTVFQARHKSDFGFHPSSLRLGGKRSSQVGDQQQIPQGLRLPARTLKSDFSRFVPRNTTQSAAFL